MAGYRRVRAGLERSLKVARAEGTVGDEHRGVVAAARVLADRLDDNLPGDNVSASVFLKYMQALGFTPMSRSRVQEPSVSQRDPRVESLKELQESLSLQRFR